MKGTETYHTISSVVVEIHTESDTDQLIATTKGNTSSTHNGSQHEAYPAERGYEPPQVPDPIYRNGQEESILLPKVEPRTQLNEPKQAILTTIQPTRQGDKMFILRNHFVRLYSNKQILQQLADDAPDMKIHYPRGLRLCLILLSGILPYLVVSSSTCQKYTCY